MIDAMRLLHAATQAVQTASPTPGPGEPGGPPPGFSAVKSVTELVQFVGYFLSIGAVGFRFGVVRRTRGISDEAKEILRADKAAMFGVAGVLLIGLALVGGPYINAIANDKTFAESLPKNLSAFGFKLAMLALALVGFTLVRVASSFGWTLAAIGILFAVLQPIYTGKLAGKVNALHILAASTWLGTLMVLTVVGIRGVIRSATAGQQRAELVCDLVNSFSPLALTAATIVGITGLTTAWLHLKRLSSLWTTGYGMSLVVKLILVAIVVALGAWNWKRVRPSLGDEGSELAIRRSATMELTFTALVLIVTSVLVTLPSPK
jgi:putative copper resistance protein D